MAALRTVLILSSAVAAACSATAPVDVRPGDTCAYCRMSVSDPKVAGQIAAPGEEPLVYDDIGCLASAIAGGKTAEHAYVADHRTGAWVRTADAVFTEAPSLQTPMGSHLVAHASEASRAADAAAASGTRTSFADIVQSRRTR